MTNNLMQRTMTMVLAAVAYTIVLQAQIFHKLDESNSILPKNYPIHGSDLLWQNEIAVRQYIKAHPEALQRTSLQKTTTYSLNDKKSWYADNLTPGKNSDRYQVPSTCRAVGNTCYIFVADSSWGTRVTQVMVDSMRIYFDSKTPANSSKGIFETDTAAFGNPPNVDGDPKIVILLLDIKDGYSGSGGYVAGYFYSFNEINSSQPGYSTSNFTEIFFIDVNPANLATAEGLNGAISTLAHEFQHMIHFNYASLLFHKSGGDMTFIDEGCSVLAEVNCGFPIYPQSFYTKEPNHYLFDWRRNDMRAVLIDYSRAARFFVYMRDQVGISLFKHIVASSQSGVPQIDDGFLAINSSFRFADILNNWFVANILDDRTVDPKYGYIYPNLPKVVERTFYDPMVSLTNDTVQNYAVQYLQFKGGAQLKATITSSNPGLLVKAVEIGPSTKRVLDVTKNVEFSETEFGTTYNEVDFVIINTDPINQATYSYTASGNSGFTATTLSYASNASAYMVLPSSNLKFATRFSSTVTGQLIAVSVELNDGTNAIQGTGNLRVSAYQNIAGSIGGIPGTQIGTSKSVPFSQLVNGGWNTIDMQSSNVSITKSTDFHIVLEVDGTVGDTLQFLVDDGITTPTNRTSSYRTGLLGLGWYNRVDPNYGGGKAPSQENLELTATIGVPTGIIELPAQTIIPARFTLSQNFPNPFNPSTEIRFELPAHSFVNLKVYDMVGREVATLVNGFKEAGSHEVKFYASSLPSGVYFYRISTDKLVETKKLVLVK